MKASLESWLQSHLVKSCWMDIARLAQNASFTSSRASLGHMLCWPQSDGGSAVAWHHMVLRYTRANPPFTSIGCWRPTKAPLSTPLQPPAADAGGDMGGEAGGTIVAIAASATAVAVAPAGGIARPPAIGVAAPAAPAMPYDCPAADGGPTGPPHGGPAEDGGPAADDGGLAPPM
eukprot:CAMPEP_0115751914 /NCGR_PEP_ID=MMETSP0272-20121206/95515_1 /TAXON_ID=71861 /ORGANISM="Scrippsiella trochoidea, Strain CCMP3099" /LENGTH=174 /DNA_ID=CAMNT_0003197135 /DNA_START=867 /DNA_END=1391 /DNA_ORIENTATION=+